MADNVIVRVPEQQFIRGEDGYSPEVTIENIDHGHSVTITDRDHPTGQSFNVMDGDSAYEQAVAGGYTGTEAQFNDELASFKELSEQATDSADRAAGHAFRAQNYERHAEDAEAAAREYADIALIRMNSADASAQAAATTATTFTEQTVPAAVNTINEAKADAISAVGNAQTTAVGAVQQESTTQQAAIQQKGEDVLDSIPSDYTELSEDVDNLKSAISQVINNLTYEIPNSQNYYIEFSLTEGKTYNITDKGSSGQFTMKTRLTKTGADIDNIGTLRAGQTVQFTPTQNAEWLVGYANSATTIYIEEIGLIATDVKDLTVTSEIYKQSFIAPCSIPLEIGTIVSGGPVNSDKYVRSCDFACAAKGDILTITPTDFTVIGTICLYSAPTNSAYESAVVISTVAIGNTYTYIFESDCYFKLRAQKGGAPSLTNDDIESFEAIISYLHHYSCRDFSAAKISPSALSLDYDSIKSGMDGKVNLAIQTDNHMSTFYRYNGATRWNPSDFDAFESAIKAMTKLGVNGFANLGDTVSGYGFDPDYETRESLKKIADDYENFGPNEKFFVIGNHDDGCLFYFNSTYNDNPQTTNVLFPAEQFNRITKHGNNNGFVQNYYFKDINGIRVIVLYQRDFDYSQGVPQIEQFKIGTTQLDWLVNTALNTNLPVLLLTHAPLVSSIYDTSRDGFDTVLTALNTFRTNGGTVIAVLSGHKHQEAEATLNGINHIVFTNGYAFFYLVSIDLTNRIITCSPINNTNLHVRTFNY